MSDPDLEDYLMMATAVCVILALYLLLLLVDAGDAGQSVTIEKNVNYVCVEKETTHQYAYNKDGWGELSEVPEEAVLGKSNYTDIGGGVWYVVNSSYVEVPDRVVYKEVSRCVEKRKNVTFDVVRN